MKKNEKVELKNKTEEELSKMVVDLRLEVSKLIIDLKMGKSKNTAQKNEKKKTITRILTILGARKLAGKEVING